ncbi:MAG: zinc-dependent metalloprotease [Bacteroidota bacterium]
MRYFFTIVLLSSLIPLGLQAQHFHTHDGETTPWIDGYEDQKDRLLQNIRQAAGGTYTARNTIYVPVKFHVGARNDGSGRLSAQRVLDQLCELNEDFLDLDIQFFLADGEINFINNTTFYTNHGSTQNTVMTSQRDPRALNVYIVENANIDGNTGGGTVLAYYIPSRDWIVITKTYVRKNDTTLAHEVGHYFSLLHTFNGWECEGFNEEDTPAPAVSSCGQVPTERANGSNCNSSGDFLCDTPADYNNGFGWNGCDFTLNVLDPIGEPIDPDERNYMSYFLECPESEYFFSVQQNNVMRADMQTARRGPLFLDPVPDYVEIAGTTANIFPEDESTTDGYNLVDFVWEEVEGATSYLLEIDRVSSFSITPIRIITSSTSAVVETLDPDRTYFWRVRPFNAHAVCTESSEVTRFRTNEDPVSVSTLSQVESFSVAPNPVLGQNELNVYLSTTETFSAQVELLDPNGRTTAINQPFEFTVGENRMNFDLSDLPNGIYFLRIHGPTGTLSQKIILTR